MTEITSEAQDDLAARAAALELRLAEVQARAAAQLVQAELKAEAVRLGMVDLDGLKLLDPAAVRVSDTGAVEGAAEALRAMRRAKPWLFGAVSSSSTASAPGAQAPRVRLATEMNHEEWQAARAELLRRR